VIQGLAAAARQHRFKRPVVDESQVIELGGNRHPVVEQLVREPFVPNDLQLDSDKKQFALITGPNMSGKSTFLRQVALTVVLAQMGSFVPADRARIGLVDKIFTRVGATDRLSRGESTFLVEMKETANILDQMTDRSLVLLDEVGRGTSTYDGLSIAWAVSEYLLQGVRARPKTLFATHFHELTQLRSAYPRLVNLKITIKEWEGGVVFLRKVVPGTSERSYGIHAARVAGLPALVLRRAEEIHKTLELRRNLLQQGVALEEAQNGQFSLFSQKAQEKSVEDPVSDDAHTRALKKMIQDFDIDASTPLDALTFVKALKDRLGDR
jgi:DNA mismatch repair protein MutS